MEETKLINSFSSLRLISTLVLLMTNIVYPQSVVNQDDILNKQVIADLPVETDFPSYFLPLQKAINFCVDHKYYVDINLQFGLFLVDMALLFYETWPEPPEPFNIEMLNKTRILTRDQLAAIYDTWETYHYNVYDVEENRPTPAEADECIALLVQSDIPHLIGRTQPNCGMSPRCKRVLLGDNEYGYGLTHRLLLLAVARFSEKCVVFTPKTDKAKSDTFCKRCYNEADYIASNNYHLPDLMFEQITVCGLFGHAQFLRNTWLKTLLRFQTTVGCFSEKLATGDFNENKLREDSNHTWSIERSSDVIYGECNAHFTAVSMVTLSHALRYIIETFY